MLIFVQVCRTIDKNLMSLYQAYVLEEQMRAMEVTKWKLELQDRV